MPTPKPRTYNRGHILERVDEMARATRRAEDAVGHAAMDEDLPPELRAEARMLAAMLGGAMIRLSYEVGRAQANLLPPL